MSDHEIYSEDDLFSGDEETSTYLTSTPVTQRWPRGGPTVESNCSPPDWMANKTPSLQDVMDTIIKLIDKVDNNAKAISDLHHHLAISDT